MVCKFGGRPHPYSGRQNSPADPRVEVKLAIHPALRAAALTCIVLGMGMPAASNYLLLATITVIAGEWLASVGFLGHFAQTIRLPDARGFPERRPSAPYP